MIVLASRSIRFVHGPFPDELIRALRNVLFFPPALILQIGIYREITFVARLRYRTRLDCLENGAPVLARISAARVAAVGGVHKLKLTKNMRKIGKLVIVVARKIYHAEAGSIGNISVRADTRCCLCAKLANFCVFPRASFSDSSPVFSSSDGNSALSRVDFPAPETPAKVDIPSAQ